MSDTNWENLIAAARTGDSRAWQTIVEHLRPDLRQIATRQLARQLRRRVDPSDVVQQSLAEAWAGRSDFTGSSRRQLESWLRRILEHNLQDEVRRHIGTESRSIERERSFDELLSSGALRPDVFVADDLSPRSQAAHREVLARIVTLVETLPPQQREAVKLRYLDRCTLADMASRLKLNENAAAQLLHRGLSNLRRLYRERETPAEG